MSPGLVKWLGAEGEIYRYGLTYIRIVVLDLPFVYFGQAGTGRHSKTSAS